MSLSEHEVQVAKELAATAGAKLEYSLLSSIVKECLAIRKFNGLLPGDRAVCGMYLLRQDLPMLRAAIRECFGDEAWPEPLPVEPLNEAVGGASASNPLAFTANLHKIYVDLEKLRPGQFVAPSGTYSHWEPEAKPTEPVKSSGGNRREFL